MNKFNLNSFVAGWCLFAAFVALTTKQYLFMSIDLVFVAMQLYAAMRSHDKVV